MKTRKSRICSSLWLAGFLVLAEAGKAWADFSTNEIPQYLSDQAPNWLFQIFSALLIALSQLFWGGLFGTTTT